MPRLLSFHGSTAVSKECAELGQRRRDIFLARNRPLYVLINTNLTFRGKKLLKLLIKKTRLIKIFEVYWETKSRK